MFISRDEIKQATGYDISQTVLSTAQLMIEAWVGKDEAEINDPSDVDVLGKATMFQAIYMSDSGQDLLEQAAIKSMTQGETATIFDTAQFAPFMSPWALKALKKLSWKGTRSVRIGSALGGKYGAMSPNYAWRHDYL